MVEPAIDFQYGNQEQDITTDMDVCSNKRILVVEDDSNLREMIGEMLEYSGHAVMLASNCKEALLNIENEAPDLILLDLSLPDGSGLDICRRTAGREGASKSATVFIISAKDSLDWKLKSFLCGAKRFFTKPFEMDELIEAISYDGLPPSDSRIARNSDVTAVA
jgi:DNA-binding response OmpR family regulator